MIPLPDDWLQHGIVLLPNAERFARELPAAVPGLDLREVHWELSGQPPVAMGHLSDGVWSWLVALDPQGLPPTLAQFVGSLRASDAARQALSRPGLAASVFLLDGPDGAGPLDELSALCCLLFGLLGLGGSAVLFPEGKRAFTAPELTFDPEQLSLEDIGFFVGSELCGETADGRGRWARTLGMEQFRLPDLACRVDYGPREAEELEGVGALFEVLVRRLAVEGAVPPSFELGHRSWRVAEDARSAPFPGALVLERMA